MGRQSDDCVALVEEKRAGPDEEGVRAARVRISIVARNVISIMLSYASIYRARSCPRIDTDAGPTLCIDADPISSAQRVAFAGEQERCSP
jgi:hypothetical protein